MRKYLSLFLVLQLLVVLLSMNLIVAASGTYAIVTEERGFITIKGSAFILIEDHIITVKADDIYIYGARVRTDDFYIYSDYLYAYQEGDTLWAGETLGVTPPPEELEEILYIEGEGVGGLYFVNAYTGEVEMSWETRAGGAWLFGGGKVAFTIVDGMLYFPGKIVLLRRSAITAIVDFKPDTLNLKSKGNYITVYIELPSGYDIREVDPSSIKLDNSVPALPKFASIGDHDNDGIQDLMVKFDRNLVKESLGGKGTGEVTVTITGTLADGTPFEGVDKIRII